MPIEIQGLAGPGRANQTYSFTFQNPVIAYTIGIWAFQISYPSTDDHWVQSLIVKILPSQSVVAGPGGYMVFANIQMTLQDSSGNNLDPSESFMWPVCVAVTGTPQPNTMMSVANNIPSGGFQPVTLPNSQSGYSVATSFLSGLNLTYTSGGDHQVQAGSAATGLTYNLNAGQVTASASLHDGKGNNVQQATVDAGFIASSYAQPPFGYNVISGQSNNPVQVTIPQLSSVSLCAFLIQSFNVAFAGVHNLQTLKVGSWGPPQVNGNVVTLPNLYAQMWDNSGNHEDDSVSSCSGLVVALP